MRKTPTNPPCTRCRKPTPYPIWVKNARICRPCRIEIQSGLISPLDRVPSHSPRTMPSADVFRMQGSSRRITVPPELADLTILLDNMREDEYNQRHEAPPEPELRDPPLPAPRRRHRKVRRD